jgi:hypothetical protein
MHISTTWDPKTQAAVRKPNWRQVSGSPGDGRYRGSWRLPQVVFVSKDWTVLGHKCAAEVNVREKQVELPALGPRLNDSIQHITGLPVAVLNDYGHSEQISS